MRREVATAQTTETQEKKTRATHFKDSGMQPISKIAAYGTRREIPKQTTPLPKARGAKTGTKQQKQVKKKKTTRSTKADRNKEKQTERETVPKHFI